jgi:Fungal Zn(2)-Cys(6) binuclear cluster domain
MCILDKTSNPTLSNSSSWRQRRPDLVLVQSTKWSYSAYRDRAYPSPPMSGSPTSPRRPTTQFTDDRSAGAFNFSATAATSAPGSQGSQTPRTSMDGPVAVPAGYQPHQHQQQYGQYRPPYPEQQRYELQPRPISTHPALAPQYQPSYSQAPQPGPLPLVPTSRSQVPGMATFQGPTSLAGASNPRVTRTSRRAKAHVARACQNCKKAHLSCDEARPCARCVSSDKQVSLASLSPTNYH